MLRRFCITSLCLCFMLVSIVAFAQATIPTDPLTGDAETVKALIDGVLGAVGSGGAAGLAGILLSVLAFALRYGVAILRSNAVQKKLPDAIKWDSLHLVWRAVIVFVVAFGALFFSALLAVGAKAALIAAATGALPMALAMMGANHLVKTKDEEGAEGTKVDPPVNPTV